MVKKLPFIGVLSLLFLCVHLSAQTPPGEKKRFTSEDKQFNDWHVALFIGGNALQNSDLVSTNKGHFTPGYDFQLQLTKEITHAFGMSLLIQTGKTFQYAEGPHIDYTGRWEGKTSYTGGTILGHINLSQLLRRMDNRTDLRWAAHFYGGLGLITYETTRRSVGGPYPNWSVIDKVGFDERSVFSQIGLGLKYKLNPKFDLELRGMYVMSGDEEFDASGAPVPGKFTLADTEEGRDDNLVTVSLGIHYKIGRHKKSLQWADPKTATSKSNSEDILCSDQDEDGVCDFQDKCPDTPAGIRVDGTGCPFDADGDGVPDSIDECPTIAGPPTNNGCPLDVIKAEIETIIENLNELIHGIDFDYKSAVIRPISYSKLNAIFDVLQSHPDYRFYVESHTDASGSEQDNQTLSQQRAEAVVRYLVNKGVPATQIIPVGKGETDLKYPECNPASNCPTWKNIENRRVLFKEYTD